MVAPAILTFDVTAFRVQFPAFMNPVMFPDATLQLYWDNATVYVSDVGNFGRLQDTSRQYALNLMTAHLTALSVIVAKGQVPNIVSASTIDKISVTLEPPPVKTEWQWWLCTTPYGQGLLALLQGRSVGGFYIGGSAPLAAFRGPGYFPGCLW
jgi:hypothetical protein